MDKIEFNARMVAPHFVDMPPELKENWLKGMKGAKEKTYRGLKKAIKTKKDFDEKIAKPVAKTIASLYDPKCHTKSGRSYQNIMDKTRDSLSRAGEHYFRERKDVFETGKYEEKLESGQLEYVRNWCEYLGPLKGYKAGGIAGLSTLAIMALTGDRKLVGYLRERNVRVEGEPLVITTPEKLNRFKRILDNRIVHWGSEIIKLGYEKQDIKRANQELNQLVNEYLRADLPAGQAGIIPFSPGGASHIDFIIVEKIPNPVKPGEKIKQLGLEIQVVAGH